MLAHRRSSNDRPASAKAAAWSRRSAARFVDGAMAEMPSNKAASYTNSDQRQARRLDFTSLARRSAVRAAHRRPRCECRLGIEFRVQQRCVVTEVDG
jgi:hypothetical protein